MNITIEFSPEDRARIDRLIEILCSPAEAVKQTQDEVIYEPDENPKEAAPETITNVAPAPSRRTVKSTAVKKIQAGHRDEVKNLIQRYGAEKIDLVPEDQLAAFLADLEAI